MSDTSNQGQTQAQAPPGLVASHAKYVQGAVSSILGYEGGEQTKKEAVDGMKQAAAGARQSDEPPAQSTVLGTAEMKVGEVTGCEGMEREGGQRIPRKIGLEEQGGTG